MSINVGWTITDGVVRAAAYSCKPELDHRAFQLSSVGVTTNVEQHLRRASEAQRKGQSATMRAALEEAIRVDPAHPVAHNLLGVEALSRNDADAARKHFAIAIKADPRAPALWLNLAKAHRLARDDKGERAALESALETDQRHLMALIRLAELHERRLELADATARWAAVATLSAEHPNAAPELRQIFDHARDFVLERTSQLATAADLALKSSLTSASARDRRRLTAAMEAMLGRRKIYTNVCHGMHYPFLPADEYFDREHFPWLSELEAKWEIIREEVATLLASSDAGLSPYVTMPPGTPRNVWTDLNNNPAWSALHLWRDGARVDGACARAPRTAAIVEDLPLAKIPNRAPTVFFSVLQAGKHIPPHTGVTNTRAIVHLPLIVPEGCTFRVGAETRTWREGHAFAFDDTIEHEAWNRSSEDRAVLIFDCWNPHLSEAERAMICTLYEVADAQKAG